jgi:hypothetical protein
MKRQHLKILIVVILAGAPALLKAQINNEYLKKQQEERKRFEQERQKDFESFGREQREGIKKLDEDFKEFLKEEWKRYELFKAAYPLQKPKPEEMPEYKGPEADGPARIVTEPEEEEQVPVPEMKVPEPKLSEVPSVKIEAPSVCSFDFYGADVDVKYDKGFRFDLPEEINGEVIAEGWGQMAASPMNVVPGQLLTKKKRMSLNDWGYYLLVRDFSEKIMSGRNERVFAQWYLLIRSNYKVRLAYAGNRLYLLIPSYNTIYEMPYFTFDGQRYYLVNGNVNNVFTYDKDYPEANIIFDLNLYRPLDAGHEIKTGELSFKTSAGEQKIEVRYNLNSISFYNDYPLANVEVYFDAAVAAVTKESFKNDLTPMIALNTEEEAVSVLLHFVQTAFRYETDQKQFGRERVFFPEELFYYPASDCEDRAVLFSFLVRELTGLDVIGVEYPGHMAVAVNFKDEVQGDYLVHEGKRYVICDPTYINAPVGATMPEYKYSRVKVIPVKKRRTEFSGRR